MKVSGRTYAINRGSDDEEDCNIVEDDSRWKPRVETLVKQSSTVKAATTPTK
jgi:hypothetical protein